MPLILPGNVASATADAGYSVANSCIWNDGDSPMMQLTPGSSATSSRKMTISFWCKLGVLGTNRRVFSAEAGSGQRDSLFFSDDDKLWLFLDNGTPGNLRTNRVFRDPSAWYHIVVAIDTEQGTNTNRVKFYVNGTQETSFDTGGDGVVWPDEDYDIVGYGQNGKESTIGADTDSGGNDNEFDGYLAEVVFIDGLQLAATSFGEFNEDSPTIWQPIDVSGLTFGTNGTYLDFEASDNLGNDANGGTDWTETNLAATDQATDTPTNNFAVLNPLDGNLLTTGTFKEGNTSWICTVDGANQSNIYPRVYSTIEVTSGKWYAECKITEEDGSSGVGISARTAISGTDYMGVSAYDYVYYHDGKKINGGFPAASYGTTWDGGDIIGVALDMDNLAVYFALNGTWQDSGDPTSGGSKTGAAYTITAPASTPNGSYKIGFGVAGFAAGADALFNFGSPAYANSSDAADGNGIGAFEYAPPSGYLALCTKNLGSDGG